MGLITAVTWLFTALVGIYLLYLWLSGGPGGARLRRHHQHGQRPPRHRGHGRPGPLTDLGLRAGGDGEA